MDENTKTKNSWWQTLPGVLTSAAALITAVGGLSVGLKSYFVDDTKITAITSPSLVGSWGGTSDCTVVISKDDHKNVEGSCDRDNYRHRFSGAYQDARNINITITRTDPQNCVTNASGYIKIISDNSIEFGQNAWNGCGVNTRSGKQVLSRE